MFQENRCLHAKLNKDWLPHIHYNRNVKDFFQYFMDVTKCLRFLTFKSLNYIHTCARIDLYIYIYLVYVYTQPSIPPPALQTWKTSFEEKLPLSNRDSESGVPIRYERGGCRHLSFSQLPSEGPNREMPKLLTRRHPGSPQMGPGGLT